MCGGGGKEAKVLYTQITGRNGLILRTNAARFKTPNVMQAGTLRSNHTDEDKQHVA